MSPSPAEVTRLLSAWSHGDREALERLAPAVEEELRRIAARHLTRERRGHSLQSTELVNEAFLRLIDWKTVEWRDRVHFYAVASKMMRRILVDHAKRRAAEKRGGGEMAVTITDANSPGTAPAVNLIALDHAMDRLAAFDERKAGIVELRFFGGMNETETAEVLNVSVRTVQRDWQLARAWLFRELGGGAPMLPSGT